MVLDYATIWAVLLSVALLAYILLDGFDLGVGILFPFLSTEEEKDIATNTIAPVWDGNETWLILGGGGLFAAFPLAFSIVMPAVYAPIIIMLLGLVFRGVAFEYRWRSIRHKKDWDFAFCAGSIIATFAQGVVLGAFVQGIEMEGRSYTGAWFNWLTPFSLLTGASLVMGYGLLGATWLILKTEGSLRDKAYKVAPAFLGLTFLAILCVSAATAFLDSAIFDRWFSLPNIFYLVPIPLLAVGLFLLMWRALRRRQDGIPFYLAQGIFFLSFAGLGISLFPYVVPRQLTVWQAAAPDKSLSFMLVGALILLPLILAYTAYAYYIFRGKVRAGDSFH